MQNITCSKCGSEKIIPQVRIMDRGHYGSDSGNLSVIVYDDPEALIFKGANEGPLQGRMCGDCGYVELFVDNPAELYEVFRAALKNRVDEVE